MNKTAIDEENQNRKTTWKKFHDEMATKLELGMQYECNLVECTEDFLTGDLAKLFESAILNPNEISLDKIVCLAGSQGYNWYAFAVAYHSFGQVRLLPDFTSQPTNGLCVHVPVNNMIQRILSKRNSRPESFRLEFKI